MVGPKTRAPERRRFDRRAEESDVPTAANAPQPSPFRASNRSAAILRRRRATRATLLRHCRRRGSRRHLSEEGEISVKKYFFSAVAVMALAVSVVAGAGNPAPGANARAALGSSYTD